MIKLLTSILFIAASLCVKAAPGITVVYDNKKKAVSIKWQQKQAGVKTFVIQRSSNNADWADIAVQSITEFNAAKVYQYYDYKPAAGENHYRLKCIDQIGGVEYSASVMVITLTTDGGWVMYPVPVRDVLTLQYKGLKKIMGVVNIFISNVTGKVITKVRSASLNTTIRIPVDNLGRGVYDVRIVIEDELVWNQRFVK